jgi:hypothetical protein
VDLIDRLTTQPRDAGRFLADLDAACDALHRAQRNLGLGRQPAEPAIAADLADAAVCLILALHSRGADSTVHLRAAADRFDPGGAGTRFRWLTPEGLDARRGGDSWRHIGAGPDGGAAYIAPAGTPAPTAAQLAAATQAWTSAAALAAADHGPAGTASAPDIDAARARAAGVEPADDDGSTSPGAVARLRAQPPQTQEVPPAALSCPLCDAAAVFTHALGTDCRECDACGFCWTLQ